MARLKVSGQSKYITPDRVRLAEVGVQLPLNYLGLIIGQVSEVGIGRLQRRHNRYLGSRKAPLQFRHRTQDVWPVHKPLNAPPACGFKGPASNML